MRQREIAGIEVGAIGLGGMPMSIKGRKDRATSIATVHAALDAGVTLIDTADSYTLGDDGQGHNEVLIAEALASYGGDTSRVLVATKGGLIHSDTLPWPHAGDPDHLKRAAKDSARRLRVESIGLYQLHSPDPDVPFEDSLGALRELFDEGVVRHVGISNVNVEQIRVAHHVLAHALVSVQNRFAPDWRKSAPELEACIELGLAFLPWSPLGGVGHASKLGSKTGAFGEVAAELGVSAQQVALAWELHLSHLIIPIPGASRPRSITDSAKAAELDLSPETMSYLSASHPA